MITDGKKWHYLSVNNLSALLKGNSSNHKGDFLMKKYSIITIAVILKCLSGLKKH